MDEVVSDFQAPIFLPPTVEEYKQRWEEQRRQLKPHEFERISEANRRKAIKEILQKQNKEAVRVKDDRLVNIFNKTVGR